MDFLATPAANPEEVLVTAITSPAKLLLAERFGGGANSVTISLGRFYGFDDYATGRGLDVVIRTTSAAE